MREKLLLLLASLIAVVWTGFAARPRSGGPVPANHAPVYDLPAGASNVVYYNGGALPEYAYRCEISEDDFLTWVSRNEWEAVGLDEPIGVRVPAPGRVETGPPVENGWIVLPERKRSRFGFVRRIEAWIGDRNRTIVYDSRSGTLFVFANVPADMS